MKTLLLITIILITMSAKGNNFCLINSNNQQIGLFKQFNAQSNKLHCYEFKRPSIARKIVFPVALGVTLFTATKGFYEVSKMIKTGSTYSVNTRHYIFLGCAVWATWSINFALK